MRRAIVATGTLICALVLAGCAEGSDDRGSDDDPIEVGLLTSLTGPLAPFGQPYVDGFEAGLDYATEGSMEVDGRPIEVVEVDDQSDPAQAVSGATKLVSDGVQIVGGTMSSGMVESLADFAETNKILYFSGYANTDKATDANDLTFRSARQSFQDVLAIASILGDDAVGKRVCLLAHDIEYGQVLVASTQDYLADKVEEFKTIMAPFPTTDVSPYVLQVKQANCDVVIPFLAGAVADWWQAFDQQAINDESIMISAVGAKVDWPALSAAQTDNVKFFSSYNVPDTKEETANDADTAMFDALSAKGVAIDYPTADGFAFAMALVEGLKSAGSDDPEELADALEGLEVDAPRGETTIRAEDHAWIAPIVQYHFEGDKRVVDQTIPGDELEPPLP